MWRTGTCVCTVSGCGLQGANPPSLQVRPLVLLLLRVTGPSGVSVRGRVRRKKSVTPSLRVQSQEVRGEQQVGHCRVRVVIPHCAARALRCRHRVPPPRLSINQVVIHSRRAISGRRGQSGPRSPARIGPESGQVGVIEACLPSKSKQGQSRHDLELKPC